MSCPKCETGLLVIERVTVEGGQQFEEWRCVNCGNRRSEEQMAGWTKDRRARFRATMQAKKAAHDEADFRAGFDATPKTPALMASDQPKRFKPITVGLENDEVVIRDLPARNTKDFSEAEVKEIFKNMDESIATQFRSFSDTPPPSPAVRELDALIQHLERQLAETRGVRHLLVQRQAVGA